jgi:hypothetical protein
MAVLKRSRAASRWHVALRRAWLSGRIGSALGLGALLFLGGCILLDALVQAERPFAFSHRLHVEEEGLECSDCHMLWEESEDPGMPVPGQCALCHEDIDLEKPPTQQVASLFEGTRFRAAQAGRQSEEILFSHQGHATRADDCSVCHAEVADDDGHLAERGSELWLSMEDCLACHASSAGPAEADCAACHSEIGSGIAPTSHHANWRRFHGTVVRDRSKERSDRCALCHQPSECTTCHQIEPPVNHNNYWRRRAHGLIASMDRGSCATCHDSDSCQRCHEETRPASHAGSWGDPRDRHCLACHEPLRGESCGVCHASAASHEQATPLPGDHLPGMNCRQCHGNGQPLPHVDNGQTCTSCHR